jgi:hypothetical protein
VDPDTAAKSWIGSCLNSCLFVSIRGLTALSRLQAVPGHNCGDRSSAKLLPPKGGTPCLVLARRHEVCFS